MVPDHYINLTVQGIYYLALRRTGDERPFDSDVEERILQQYTKRLQGKSIECTFDAVFSVRPNAWHPQDDLVDPFVEGTDFFVLPVWIYDIDHDVLRYHRGENLRMVPLSLARERELSMRDLKPYEPVPTPLHSFPILSTRRFGRSPIWSGISEASLDRRRELLRRLLFDFSGVWRHVLNRRYSESTFRKLATAIVRIASLDFTVRQRGPRSEEKIGPPVDLSSLPEWEPFSDNIVQVGATFVIMTQHPASAVKLIRQDYESHFNAPETRSLPESQKSRTYLILSVRGVAVYRKTAREERCTELARLFEGNDHLMRSPASDEAIEWLLTAAMSGTPTSISRKLPTELQRMILDRVSGGPIETARLKCILDLDSPFTWTRGARIMDVMFQTQPPPIDLHVMFDDKHESGLMYRWNGTE